MTHANQTKTALVTGAGGFVGGHMVDLLAESGFRVVAVGRSEFGNRFEHSPAVETVLLDIASPEFEALLKDSSPDYLFHFAGQSYAPTSVESPARDFVENVANTFHILESLRTSQWPGRLVFASSGAVYGNSQEQAISEDTLPSPISPYGASKLAAEQYVKVYAACYGLQAASIRFFSLFGPRQHKQVVFDIIDKLHQNPAQISLRGDGTQERDFCYIKDAVRAALLVAQQGVLAGEVYNVASGSSTSIRDLMAAIAQALSISEQLDVEFSGNLKPGEPERWQASIDRIAQLGYAARYSLAEGIAETAAWYAETLGKH